MKGRISVYTVGNRYRGIAGDFRPHSLVCIVLFAALLGIPSRLVCLAAQETVSNLRTSTKRISDLNAAKPLQRFVVLPQKQLLTVPSKKPSEPVRVYCLDKDLDWPKQWVPYKHIHTRNQQFVTVGSDPPITFEQALAVGPNGVSILSAEVSSTDEFHLRFKNNSSQDVRIEFARASVFGRVEGRLDEQNERDAKLLKFLNNPELTQWDIWNATARLVRLRTLGFWPADRPPDAVTSEAQDQAELAARTKLAVPAADLDRILRDRENKAGRTNSDVPDQFIVTIRPVNSGVVLVNGIAVSEVRLRGSWDALEKEFARQYSYVQYSNDGYEIDVRRQPLAWPVSLPPRVSGGHANTGGPPRPSIWVELTGRDFVAVANKAMNECSIEYCVSSEAPGNGTSKKQTSRADQQIMVECNNVGFGLSTSGKVEVKLGPFSVEGP